MKKWPILLVVLCLALLAQDRQPKLSDWNNKRYELRITGHTVELSVEQFGSSQILRKLVVETKGLTISADEMVYNQDTGEIEPRGNVRVKLNESHIGPA